MNPGDPNQQQGGQWSPAPPGQSQTGGFPGHQGQTAQFPGGPPTGGWGPAPGMGPRRAGPRPDRSVIFALGAAVAGIVTYCMGFVSWITALAGSQQGIDLWERDFVEGRDSIPGFFSDDMVLNPGKFFVLLGVVGVATTFVLVPRYRKALPFLAVIALAGWLALFASALIMPPSVELGAGAILGLIFGLVQVALLMTASFLYGLKKDDAAIS
ncbi:hypothetical protein GONAM_30_00320 [Gordonia namibiensis NBRC 108229]|uniref:DUF5336 domain-containing protein n=1 Tax=Gordonia namibiensis NBRC 108229 TaxID=1208314 RepID=K6XB43_9ACTN|nr:hypothetical protein GONAM_30_00320 [Gordonia namibiensis NBRC 108229]